MFMPPVRHQKTFSTQLTPIPPICCPDNVQKMVSIQSATTPPTAIDTEFFVALDQLLGHQDLVTDSAFVEDFTFLPSANVESKSTDVKYVRDCVSDTK